MGFNLNKNKLKMGLTMGASVVYCAWTPDVKKIR